MAKFKLRPELISVLTTRNVINGSGNITINIPYKTNRISGEKAYQVVFNPSTHCLQTSNDFVMTVLRKRTSPAIKVGGSWLIDDPVNPWFTELSDADPMAAVNVEMEGTEVLTRKQRKFLKQYLRETKADPPTSLSLPDSATHMANARAHFEAKFNATKVS